MQKLYDQCLKIVNNQLDEYDEQIQRDIPEGEHAEEHLPPSDVRNCPCCAGFNIQVREAIESNIVALMEESTEICKVLKSLKENIRQYPELVEMKKLKHLVNDDDFETEDAKETVIIDYLKQAKYVRLPISWSKFGKTFT